MAEMKHSTKNVDREHNSFNKARKMRKQPITADNEFAHDVSVLANTGTNISDSVLARLKGIENRKKK